MMIIDKVLIGANKICDVIIREGTIVGSGATGLVAGIVSGSYITESITDGMEDGPLKSAIDVGGTVATILVSSGLAYGAGRIAKRQMDKCDEDGYNSYKESIKVLKTF